MSTFLQLVQRTFAECGVSGSAPMTTVGQINDISRIVNWVNTAWMDIQMERQDWGWMKGQVSFATINQQGTYTPAQCGVTDFGSWDRDSFRNYDTSAGTGSELFMDYIDYDEWRNNYQFGALRASYSRPLEITITPDKSLGLGQIPVSGYTVVGEYYKTPTEMSLDADIPSLPTKFHMAIVYRAMMSYGGYEAASEVYQRGETEFKKIMRRIRADQGLEVQFCGALA